jgi:plasmid stabilization system protein ParE
VQTIREYVGQFNPVAARRIAAALIVAADSLVELPERGRPIGHGRRELAAIWPYVIRYRIVGDAVIVLRIRHGKQRPI